MPFENVPAEERASQGQKRLMDVSPLLIPNAQAAELVQPGESPLYDPSPSAEAATVLGVAHREQRQDAASTQTLPD